MIISAAAAANSLKSCLTLCDPIDGSLPGSPVPGILQARVLEWGAIAFSMIISIDVNSIWKNSTLIHYKTLRKLGIEENLIKIIYKNSQH